MALALGASYREFESLRHDHLVFDKINVTDQATGTTTQKLTDSLTDYYKMNYHSQLGQDKFVDDFFNHQENLVFLDIGAHDGITLSNTYFLEKERNWKGICVEPQPKEFLKLTENRTCICVNVAVSDFEGETEFTCVDGYANMLSGISSAYDQRHLDRLVRDTRQFGGSISRITVPVKKLQTILDEHTTTEISFCSIDVEGAELSIVKSIDFDKTNIKMLIMENNYQEQEVRNFLQSKGYILHKKLDWDDVFVKSV